MPKEKTYSANVVLNVTTEKKIEDPDSIFSVTSEGELVVADLTNDKTHVVLQHETLIVENMDEQDLANSKLMVALSKLFSGRRVYVKAIDRDVIWKDDQLQVLMPLESDDASTPVGLTYDFSKFIKDIQEQY